MSQIFFALPQILSECFPWKKSQFIPSRDIPDLSGKVILVTGGNAGIGKTTVRELLRKNAKVYIGCRSQLRAEETIAELKGETGKEAIFLELDLASMASVTRAADAFKSKEAALHILYNSAGVMLVASNDILTVDGYDLTFGTNLLGHAHLTLLLLPELTAGAKSSPDGRSKIVNVASVTAHYARSVDYKVLRACPERKGPLFRWNRYTESKLAIVLFSNELAKRYADLGIVSVAVNPGDIRSGLTRTSTTFEKCLIHPIQYPMEPYGPLTTLFAGVSRDSTNFNGKWIIPWARIGEQPKYAQDEEEMRKLWDWIEEQRARFA